MVGMDQAAQPEDAAAIAHEERRADVQRRIDEVAGVLAETLLGMWRARHRAQQRGESWPPPEPPKPEPPLTSGQIEKPKGPPRRVFRELEARDELVANMLLEMTWFPAAELGLEPEGGKRTRVVLEYGRVIIGVAVLDAYGDAAVLRGLAIRSTYRRRKHGSALVEYIVRHAYEVGVGRLYAASAMPWFAEEVGFELRKRTKLPEDARRLPGIIDAPGDALVFELTPTQNGRRVPRRSVQRSAVEALLMRSEPLTGKLAR
jgi:GNAT superfamily N-acetyltransferase